MVPSIITYVTMCYMFIPTSRMAYGDLAKKYSRIPGNLGTCLTYTLSPQKPDSWADFTLS